MDTNEKVKEDATEFGVHIKQGGWRLGLLVARNVEKSRPGPKIVSTETNSKVSATQFADESGTSPARVLRYLKGWNRAADAGHVPHPDQLTPGQEVALDADNLPDWSDYYAVAGLVVSEERRKTYEAAADEAGTTPGNVARTANNPAAVGAAIKADPNVRKAALDALDEHYERPERRRKQEDERTKDPVRLHLHLRNIHKAVEHVTAAVVDGTATVDDDVRRHLVDECDWLLNALTAIKTSLDAGSIDREWAKISGGDA